VNNRGWSRQDRLAQMKQKLLQNKEQPLQELSSFSRKGSVDSMNPINEHSADVQRALHQRDNKESAVVQEEQVVEEQPLDNREGYFFPICWFIVALGMMSAWTAMMTFLGVFKKLFGGDIFLW
jgi:hypothetical protein